ncbi:MAG: hypothetical protein KC592_11505 [Nitrospira sp.]|nr:hypothetical protein [Nitrospira sp.]MCW5784604.1 hypothetical protein [Nitrospirales bacterium]
MGLQLLLDKSTLQSFSYDETWVLKQYYYVVYAPILFIEILGDLKKVEGNDEKSQEIVARVAKKIQLGDSCFTANYRILLKANLLGHKVDMDRRPFRLGGEYFTDSTGRRGILFEEEPERESLRHWVAGEFTEAEHALSKAWRFSTRTIDLEKWQKIANIFPSASSLNDLRPAVQRYCDDPNRQLQNLQFLLGEAGIPDSSSSPICNRWRQCGMPRLRSFAPYAYYCLTVFISFYTALANRLIGTRPTNRVDLEYLLYLPFCYAFSSSDNFHRQFASLFLTTGQDFIDGLMLKQDISRIQAHWASISEPERKKYREQSGSYPPDWDDSITNHLWKKHMKPRSEYKGLELTPERRKRLMEHLQPILDAVEQIKKTND